ncbi:MAG: flagellar biosynthesis regulator FlaF [Phenylobacterium sp.]
MSLRAYQQAATRAETPRETEFRLFSQVTLALVEASRLDPKDISGRISALDSNRRLWSVLAIDCGHADNQLPKELRAGIISLSIWVNKHTSEVVRGQEDIQDLIDVNRMIMQGLSSRNQPEA